MTDRPTKGGRYVRDDKGKLKRVSKTKPAAPGAPPEPAPKTSEKEA